MNIPAFTFQSDFDMRLRRARIVYPVIMLIIGLDHARLLFSFGQWFSALMLFVAIPLASFFLWRRKIELTGITIAGFITIDVFQYLFRVSGIGWTHAIIFWLIGMGAVILTFETAYHKRMGWSIGAISASFVLFDLLWPYPRAAETNPLAANVVLIAFVVIGGLVLIGLLLRDFNNFNMQSKLLISVSSIVTASVLITIIALSIIGRNFSLEQVRDLQRTVSETFASNLGDQLQRDLDFLQIIAADDRVERWAELNFEGINEDRELIVSELQEIESNWDDEAASQPFRDRIAIPTTSVLLAELEDRFATDISNLILINNLGKAIAHSGTGELHHYYFGDEYWWGEAVEQGVFLGLPIDINELQLNSEAELNAIAQSKLDNGNYLIQYAVAIYDDPASENRQLEGMLVAQGSLLSIGDFVNATSEFGSSLPDFALAFSPNFLVSIQQGNDGLTVDTQGLSDETRSTIGQDGYFLGDYKESEQLITLSTINYGRETSLINTLGWELIAFEDADEALAGVNAQRRILILIGLGILALGAFIAVIIARLIVTPLKELTDVAQEFASGNYNATVEINSDDEIGQLATTFTYMAGEVRSSLQNMEFRVLERTQALNASLRISRLLSTKIREDELVRSVIDELKDEFEYYHIHIYILDQKSGRLNMRAGSGEVGQILLERNHSLALGQGLVGRAAESQAPILVPDVSTDLGWNPNELLPETKSELAVPLVIGQTTLGVIDIQENEVNKLDEQDQALIETIAGQLAVSLRNASFLAEAEKRAAQEAKVNTIRQRILESTNVESALKTAAKELSMATAAPVEVRLNVNNGRRPQTGSLHTQDESLL